MIHQSSGSKKSRIVFLDLIRAFAVLMMVQGHTTDVFLSDAARDPSYIGYSIWHFMRGMTAPIFLFTSGTVFMYLLRISSVPFSENIRVKKGLKRFLLLVGLGYLLRYPTWTIFDFRDVEAAQWRIFFGVDVLHLIGFGLLFIILLSWLSNNFKKGDYVIFPFAALVVIVTYLFIMDIPWTDYLHPLFAGYLYRGSGSIFPFFPWLAYMFMGALLGSYIAKNQNTFTSMGLSIRLAIAGVVLIVLSLTETYLLHINDASTAELLYQLSIIFQRLGFVFILNGLFVFIALKMDSIPKIIILLGRNTLIIYVVHLIILYGSAWNIGAWTYYKHALSTFPTIAFALGMIALMTGMVYLLNMLKMKHKQLVN